MNRLFKVLLGILLSVSLVACSETNSSQKEKVAGFGGEFEVTVSFDDNKITEIVVGEHKETAQIGTTAIDTIPGEIIAKQSLLVDSVAGATTTSTAIKTAVENAIVKQGLNVEDFKKEVEVGNVEMTDETKTADIVVIGAGGAGLTAAIEATLSGKTVVIIEKQPFAGGNTSKATGGMNAAETKIQAAEGIEDTVETFISDIYKGGYELGNIDLITKMANESASAVEWLETVGAPLTQVSFSGGATYSRIHQPEGGAAVGAYIVENLVKKAEELNIEILYNTKVTDIIKNDDKVVGVKANSETVNYTFDSKAVILATGGFGANEELFSSYKPELKGFVTTNHKGATGDGIVMAQAIGADVVDLEQIQIHPTVHQDTSIMITEGVRGDGGILVNQEGLRFTNEMLTRDVVSANVIAQTGGYAYVIFDQNLREHLAATEKYINNGITSQADTIGELAKILEVDEATLETTLATWNQAVANKEDKEFNRTTAMEVALEKGPYYAVKIAPGVHHTMGGIKIDTDAKVIDTNGDAILGLYAAGEVTGGIHGGNRIGGTAVTDIVVFGRISGMNASLYVDSLK